MTAGVRSVTPLDKRGRKAAPHWCARKSLLLEQLPSTPSLGHLLGQSRRKTTRSTWTSQFLALQSLRGTRATPPRSPATHTLQSPAGRQGALPTAIQRAQRDKHPEPRVEPLSQAVGRG